MAAAVLVAGSEKAAAHRLELSHSTVKHLLANARSKVWAGDDGEAGVDSGPRLPEPGATPERNGWQASLRLSEQGSRDP